MNTASRSRVALVTGSSRGLGRAMAVALGEMGLAVAVNYASNEQAAEEAVAMVKRAGGRASAFRADVGDEVQVRALVSQVEASLGPIDVLVNNAGVGTVSNAFDQSHAEWIALLRINLDSAFLVSSAVIPGMRDRRHGRLVFMSSIAARVGGLISPAYAASKAGLEGLMHYYATHLLKYDITANAISPALIETDMVAGIALPPREQMPLGRLGRPDEVGAVLQMLVKAEFVTGQTIQINAGRYHT